LFGYFTKIALILTY